MVHKRKREISVAGEQRVLQQKLFDLEERGRLQRKQERELQEIYDEHELTRWLIYYEGEEVFWSWYETVKDNPERLVLMRNRLAKLEAHAKRIANEKADGEKGRQGEANG